MVNAYLLYHRLHQDTDVELPDFRTEVAEYLCLASAPVRKRGRPTSATPPPSKIKRAYVPQIDIRYDQVAHWCTFLDRSGKRMCKMPGCKSETRGFCAKCNLNLCNTNTKNCFYEFHNMS